jgi:hypothetical protein
MILPSMILLLFSSAGGQSHIFTYFRSSAVVYPLIGSWRLAVGFGLRETAHSRLKLGSARRSNPTHFFRFALIRVIRGPVPHIHTAVDCRGYNSMPGRRGISHGGTEAQRGNERWPGLTLLPMILPSMILLFFFVASRLRVRLSLPPRGSKATVARAFLPCAT